MAVSMDGLLKQIQTDMTHLLNDIKANPENPPGNDAFKQDTQQLQKDIANPATNQGNASQQDSSSSCS